MERNLMYYFTGSSGIRFLLEKVLQLLYPMGTYCICCGKYVDITRTYCLCDQCMAAINWGHIYIDLEEERRESGRTKYLDSALSCMVYGLHSKRLVFDLKYNKKTFMSRPISMIMADRLLTDESLSDMLQSIDHVVPVPLHDKKRKERGFNQAALIAKDLTRRLNSAMPGHKIDIIPDCLLRSRSTAAQRSVTGEQRFANLEGAFSFNEKHSETVKGSSVLLVDDIFTTGATADHCARLLKENGASEVHFISLATGNYWLKGSFRPRGDESFLDQII
ncbi:MAG: ComF family protein [Firmicutes bacterium]|nr:ComF family protein [Bacillota bacterium]